VLGPTTVGAIDVRQQPVRLLARSLRGRLKAKQVPPAASERDAGDHGIEHIDRHRAAHAQPPERRNGAGCKAVGPVAGVAARAGGRLTGEDDQRSAHLARLGIGRRIEARAADDDVAGRGRRRRPALLETNPSATPTAAAITSASLMKSDIAQPCVAGACVQLAMRVPLTRTLASPRAVSS
jgi:hypothetical protein